MRGEAHAGRGRGPLVAGLAVAVSSALSGCVPGQGPECGGAGGCAAVVSVPTSDAVAEDTNGGAGLEGTLRAAVRRGQVCLYLNRGPDAPAVNLVLPRGTRATPLEDLPVRGEVQLRLLGEAGIGGIRTGDMVRVSLERSAATVAVPGCGKGSVVEVRWIATTRAATPSAEP